MNAPMSEQQLAEILARADAATAGPWKWSGNTEVRDMRLQAQHHGGLTVMDFERWGMQSACPRFAKNWAMYRADEMVEYQVHQLGWVDKSEPPYRADISGIDHPDARFIAAAREDVPALLAEVQRLRAERHSTNEALSEAAEALRVSRDRIAELETTLKKYVGVEPTVAEELAYVTRCLFAVYAVCDAAEKQATRWENPLPVPGWVAMVRNAADGVVDAAAALPPAAPRQAEDPHTSELHHDYVLGRDDLAIPRQVTGRCPNGHTFEDCTCGGAA